MKRESTSAPPTFPSNGSAERTLRLLQLLSEQGRAMTLAELAESLDLPKATTHRLCSRLEALEFMVRDIDGRRFTVGPALRRLALDTLNRDLSGGLRHEVLTNLVEKVGETCNFTTLDGASVLYLDRVEAQRPWRLTLSVGVHVPLHCTASGKLFLAFLPEGEREALLERLTLDALTENTLTDVDALRASLAEIAERGHAFEEEEFVVGLTPSRCRYATAPDRCARRSRCTARRRMRRKRRPSTSFLRSRAPRAAWASCSDATWSRASGRARRRASRPGMAPPPSRVSGYRDTRSDELGSTAVCSGSTCPAVGARHRKA